MTKLARRTSDAGGSRASTTPSQSTAASSKEQMRRLGSRTAKNPGTADSEFHKANSPILAVSNRTISATAASHNAGSLTPLGSRSPGTQHARAKAKTIASDRPLSQGSHDRGAV